MASCVKARGGQGGPVGPERGFGGFHSMSRASTD